MSFAQRRPLPQPEAGQSIFSGREKEIGLYRLHFHRAKDNPQVRLITAVSGPGGTGKTRLLDELEWYRPAHTIYSRIDGSANFGHDATQLMRTLADGLHREGEPIPTPQFDRLYQHRQKLLEKALTRSSDPKQILRHFYRPTLLGLDPNQPIFTPDLDQFAHLRWAKEDLALAFENPVGLMTQALVGDLNEAVDGGVGNREGTAAQGSRGAGEQGSGASDGAEAPLLTGAGEQDGETAKESISNLQSPNLYSTKIVLMFDDFEDLPPSVNEWLLTQLLGYAREAIECDLRLVIAGREDLPSLDERWAGQWA
ncbi:MAG: hypothetical protein GY796_00625, partial [Chloroflexi bacterium]|nr:hypothetical protein [Chloroflexota bacterium]